MPVVPTLYLLYLWGCTTSTDDSATNTPIDPCTVETPSIQEITGHSDCRDGRCTIPAGESIQGAANPNHPDQCPPHIVTLPSFEIAQTEVTVEEWQHCVDAGNCAAQPEWCMDYPDDASPQMPVTCISWQQAQDYCLSQGGRLPTEAEWEVAARGREGNPWSWQNGNPSCTRANFKFVTAYCHGHIVDVGSYTQVPTWFGLSDVAGNVWEWTADWYDAHAYLSRNTRNPVGPSEGCHLSTWNDPSDCDHKVIRGGAYDTTEDTLAPYARSLAHIDLIATNIGFRCVWD